MAEKYPGRYNQSGVLPFRCKGGETEVLLITSRRKKRWIIPKGIIEPGLTSEASALKEALEEAGIRGTLRHPAVGRYHYKKWGGICTVEVFLLRVEEVADTWPEASIRTRRWVRLEEALALVKQKPLQALLRQALPLCASQCAG